ncbi:MAG: 4-hydroxythreonine-4-phosphate dehydrogenase PdxA [Marinosulfonomonas sp.]|nr:4-hydroxythreonine-4-phosphate dehydrogenase PdxA [Marinosulfonomonas sp.]
MRPKLPAALTCGEPAGIGPELAAKAWRELGTDLPFFLIGDPTHLPGDCPVIVISDPAQTAAACVRGLPVLALPFPEPATPGAPARANAALVIDAIRTGVDLVQAGKASALCTNPIHKKALVDGAGFAHPGHTEFLAELAGVKNVVMMLASDALRVVPTTIHIPLAEVPGALNPGLIADTIRITHQALKRDFGIAHPRLAVAGLNPHAGEGGVIGGEEIATISPALEQLRAEGIELTGPMSADTMFHAAARKQYDAAICMYHDQALIPIKTLAFDSGVNVTLGLPFVRTSPDHGTALDIAGQGAANPTSLIAALRMARDMAQARAGG